MDWDDDIFGGIVLRQNDGREDCEGETYESGK